jgi:DNA polymerase-1
MEAHGMLVDRAYLAEVEKVACKERAISINRFRKWAAKYCSSAQFMNVTSDAQIRQLLFGGYIFLLYFHNFC